MSYQIPPGMFDIIPLDQQEKWRSSYLWQWVEQTVRRTCDLYTFYEMRTPILERTELFQKGTGEDTDIVTKEMYTFEDRGGRSLTLRPEGTPPILRAYIEKQLHMKGWPQKFYYLSPMFRYERQQAGRYRQHHQFGVEAVGSEAPEQDAEVIDLLISTYRALGIQDVTLHLNSLGNADSRVQYRSALIDYLTPHASALSEDSQRRLTSNPLRILDSKAPEDREILASAPVITDFLDQECREHFEQVKQCLDSLEVAYTVTPSLVRGLDYYTKTVFEVTAGQLGAQNSIGGGGRYDGLVKSLGGPDLPGVGFGSGIERIIQTLLAQHAKTPPAPAPQLYIAALGDAARQRAFVLTRELRARGVSTHMDFTGRKVGKLMQKANASGAQFATILGDRELETGMAKIKTMHTGKEAEVALDRVGDLLQKYTKSDALEGIGDVFKGGLHSMLQEVITSFAQPMANSMKKPKEQSTNDSSDQNTPSA